MSRKKKVKVMIWKCRKCGKLYQSNERWKHKKVCTGEARIDISLFGKKLGLDAARRTVGSDGKPDSVHYGGADNPHETIKCLAAWGLERDALCWNSAKYISRAGKKEGATLLRDLEKAHYYLGKRIAKLKEAENAKA